MEKTIFTEWCIVEMMGHRRIAGHVTERTIAGHGFLEVRIPSEPPLVQFIQPSSIYAMTPCTEETARSLAKTLSPEPISYFDAKRMLAVDAPSASEASRPWHDTNPDPDELGNGDDDFDAAERDHDMDDEIDGYDPIPQIVPNTEPVPIQPVSVNVDVSADATPTVATDPNEVLF